MSISISISASDDFLMSQLQGVGTFARRYAQRVSAVRAQSVPATAAATAAAGLHREWAQHAT